MGIYNVSFNGNVDLALPDDVDLDDAAFEELIRLIPTAYIEIEEIEEV